MRSLVDVRGALAARLQSRCTLPIVCAVVVQVLVLVCILRFSANQYGGDLCRDAVTTHRLLAGQNPYQWIGTCGVLWHTPHPPAWLLLITPFMLLPISWGVLAWDLAALVALAGALAVVAAELRLRLSPWGAALALAFIIFWPPLLGTLLEGQVSTVLLLLCALAWRWTRHGKTAHAGLALGLAAALRLFPALLVIYFALRRDWRAVLAAGAAFAVASLALLPIVGVSSYAAYLTREVPASTADWIAHPHNTSLSGVVYHVLGSFSELTGEASLPRMLGILLGAALVAALLVVSYQRRSAPLVQDEATWLAYIPAAMLVTPLMWIHYYVLLLLPLAVLAARLGWLGAPATLPVARRPLLTWLGAAGVVLIWLSYAVSFVWTPPTTPAVMPGLIAALVEALPTVALLAVLAALLVADAPEHRWARVTRVAQWIQSRVRVAAAVGEMRSVRR
jgi:hypothetical protein